MYWYLHLQIVLLHEPSEEQICLYKPVQGSWPEYMFGCTITIKSQSNLFLTINVRMI